MRGDLECKISGNPNVISQSGRVYLDESIFDVEESIEEKVIEVRKTPVKKKVKPRKEEEIEPLVLVEKAATVIEVEPKTKVDSAAPTPAMQVAPAKEDEIPFTALIETVADESTPYIEESAIIIEEAVQVVIDNSTETVEETGVEEVEEDCVPLIDKLAVEWYMDYFNKMMQYFTFELNLFNGETYYVFSDADKDEWGKKIKNNLSVEATRYLDKVDMKDVPLNNIKTIRDVTTQVREQYYEQRTVIYNSYVLVEQIMQYHTQPFVEKMINYVIDNREQDVSKRKFWRIVNEKYYGLDIHPLMEYEMEELEKILYYCEHPGEQRILKWNPVLRTSAISAGTALIGWLSHMYMNSH